MKHTIIDQQFPKYDPRNLRVPQVETIHIIQLGFFKYFFCENKKKFLVLFYKRKIN